MKRLLLLMMTLIGFSSVVWADQVQMNETLVRLVNQLDAMIPLIEQAQREQPENTRFTFQFEKFEGSDGVMHNGLKDDVLAIRQALIDQINQPMTDPDTIPPMTDDFIGRSL